jgi:hypothetical protein
LLSRRSCGEGHGNVTGVLLAAERTMTAKRLELIKAAVPPSGANRASDNRGIRVRTKDRMLLFDFLEEPSPCSAGPSFAVASRHTDDRAFSTVSGALP